MARLSATRYRPLIGWLFAMVALPPIADDSLRPAPDPLTTIEQRWQTTTHLSDHQQRLRQVQALLQELRALPAQSCVSHWLQAEILMDIADIKHNLDSLADLNQARQLLENCLGDPSPVIAGTAAAILGHLYLQVPGFPLSFGDRDKAAEYLANALRLAPDNMAVNYYYGDHLIRQGHPLEAEKFLRKGLAGHIYPGFSTLETSYRQIIAARLESAPSEKP